MAYRGWNGTRLRRSWLRSRGNASGRKRPYWARKFFCVACQREHGPYINRTMTLDGRLICDRQYYREQERKHKPQGELF